MYESFFGLTARPFPAAPLVQHYFPTAVTEQARQTLIRIVDRAEGPGLIIGQPGLGKTLLLRMLDHHFQNVFHCVHLASAAIESRKDLLQNVLFELDLPYRNMEEGELRLSLLDFLRPSESCPHGVLLLVDEAHTLPLQLLDEIRMITNLVRDGQPRVRLVLAGDAQLDDVFADPRLDSFNQRIAARCYLEPLNQEQTIEYVQAQIASIGGEPAEIFTPDALVAVYRASGGIPRLINQVCDHSLVMASLGGYQQLDVAGIEEAWADLQQLPGPWNEPALPASASAESIVEFGSLDEDDAAATSPLVAEPFDAPAESSDRQPTQVADAAGEGDAAPAAIEPRSAAADAAGPAAGSVAAAETEVAAPAAETEVAAPLADAETASAADPGNEAPLGDTWWNSEQLVFSAPAELDAVTAELEAVTAELEAPQRVEPASETVETGPEFVDPFGQGFDEEEVVVDRYASLDSGVFAGCPCVSSEEGRALAAIIEQQSGPRLSVVDLDSAVNAEPEAAVEEPVEASPDQLGRQPQHDQRDPTQREQLDPPQAVAPLDAPAGKRIEVSDEFAADADLAIEALANNVFDTASLSNWLFESTTETVAASAGEAGRRSRADGEPTPPAETAPAEPVGRDPSRGASRVESPVVEDEPEPSFLQVHGGPHCNDDRDMIVIDEDENAGVFLTQSGDDLARRVEYQQLFSQLREG